jgi:phosphopentomutase
MKRVIFIVLDSVGLIEAPDAKAFGDVGASTLGNLFRYRQKQNKIFKTDNLNDLGLDDLLHRHKICSDQPKKNKNAAWGTSLRVFRKPKLFRFSLMDFLVFF